MPKLKKPKIHSKFPEIKLEIENLKSLIIYSKPIYLQNHYCSSI